MIPELSTHQTKKLGVIFVLIIIDQPPGIILRGCGYQ